MVLSSQMSRSGSGRQYMVSRRRRRARWRRWVLVIDPAGSWAGTTSDPLRRSSTPESPASPEVVIGADSSDGGSTRRRAHRRPRSNHGTLRRSLRPIPSVTVIYNQTGRCKMTMTDPAGRTPASEATRIKNSMNRLVDPRRMTRRPSQPSSSELGTSESHAAVAMTAIPGFTPEPVIDGRDHRNERSCLHRTPTLRTRQRSPLIHNVPAPVAPEANATRGGTTPDNANTGHAHPLVGRPADRLLLSAAAGPRHGADQAGRAWSPADGCFSELLLGYEVDLSAADAQAIRDMLAQRQRVADLLPPRRARTTPSRSITPSNRVICCRKSRRDSTSRTSSSSTSTTLAPDASGWISRSRSSMARSTRSSINRTIGSICTCPNPTAG